MLFDSQTDLGQSSYSMWMASNSGHNCMFQMWEALQMIQLIPTLDEIPGKQIANIAKFLTFAWMSAGEARFWFALNNLLASSWMYSFSWWVPMMITEPQQSYLLKRTSKNNPTIHRPALYYCTRLVSQIHVLSEAQTTIYQSSVFACTMTALSLQLVEFHTFWVSILCSVFCWNPNHSFTTVSSRNPADYSKNALKLLQNQVHCTGQMIHVTLFASHLQLPHLS